MSNFQNAKIEIKLFIDNYEVPIETYIIDV
jgi:hypothetical protein